MADSFADRIKEKAKKAGDALLDEESVMEIMQNPKMVEAIATLKEDPTAYERLVSNNSVN